MRRARGIAVGVLLVCARAQAKDGAGDAITTTSQAADAKRAIQPRAERSLGEVERPTYEKKTEREARDERRGRIKMQIPERLRAALEAKIEQRISRNIAQAKQLRREAIGLLTKFIEETPEGEPEMAEALMRLGELEWERARDRFLLDFKRWESAPLEQRGAPPVPDYEQPRARFLEVLENYKTFPDYDLALYVDGFLATEVGKHDEALDRFNKILDWFPKSRFVPDAHMVRAEYEFTKDFPNYEVAYQEYEQVLRYEDSELYDIALFKSAWCLWRLGQTDEAARRFLTVFKTTAEASSAGRRRAELGELQAEALRNLVAVFVEDEKNKAADMHRFLVKAGGEKFAGEIVEALAEAFYDQAHYERGIEAYRLLLKLEPMDPEAYQWGLMVARGQSTMELWKPLDEQYEFAIEQFTLPEGKTGHRSAWARAQTPATLDKAEAAIEKQLRQDAVSLHAKAQADKTSRVEYEAASALYATYLGRFSKRPQAYEMYFNHAEINFYHLDNEATAAKSYLAAVRMRPKGKLSRDALYNALAALEAAREKEFLAAKKAGESQKETPTDKQLTSAMELYIETYPDDPVVPELLFRQGKLYYDYEVYDPAVRQWGLLLEKYPNSEYSVGAGELILDSFNKSKDYENIETWARRLKSAPAFQTQKQQKRLDVLIVQAVFKQGEQLSEQGKHASAAKAYLRAAREFPEEPRAAQAAVNAEIESRRAADLTSMKEAADLLIQHHPGRKEAAEGVWIAATTYQSVGLLSEAADYHATLVEKFPGSEHRQDAAYNAVLLRTTVGEHDKAIESGKAYEKYFPRADDADEVVFLMGKAHEKAKKWKEAEALYNRYSRTAKLSSNRIEALVRLATVRYELGDDRGADAALSRARQNYRTYKRSLDDDGKYFAAKARYMQGQRIVAEFDRIQIEGDVEQLKTRLKKKSNLLKKAADAFLETAEMGVAEWTTAALYEIGRTYESFAKALLDAPAPENMSPEQQNAYMMQIDTFVIPIEERSIEAYESGWLKAVELGIFNEWTAKMREALGRLNTELYPPLEEIGFELRFRGPTPLPGLIDAPRRTHDGRSRTYLLSEAKASKEGGGESSSSAESETNKPAEQDEASAGELPSGGGP